MQVPDRPLISVVIPAYNAQDTIARAIRSALDQSYDRVEVVVGDDGSTDDTLGVIEKHFPQVLTATGENVGPNGARNRGAQHAKGEVLAFLDADDAMPPNRLEKQWQVLQELPNPGALCTGVVKIYGQRVVRCDPNYLRGDIVTPDFRAIAYQRCGHLGASVMMLREVFEEFGGFDPTPKEKELYLRIVAAGCTVARLNLPLYFIYRDEGTLRTDVARMYASELDILARWDPQSASDSPLTSEEHAKLSLHWQLRFAVRFMQIGDRAMTRQCLREARRLAEALGTRLPLWVRIAEEVLWPVTRRLAGPSARAKEHLAVWRARCRQAGVRRRMAELGIPWPLPAV